MHIKVSVGKRADDKQSWEHDSIAEVELHVPDEIAGALDELAARAMSFAAKDVAAVLRAERERPGLDRVVSALGDLRDVIVEVKTTTTTETESTDTTESEFGDPLPV